MAFVALISARAGHRSGVGRLGMWRALLTLGLAVFWDRFLGEPPKQVHPVVWMGRAVEAFGGPTGDREADLKRGLVAAVALPLASMAVAAAAGRVLNRMGPVPAVLGGAFLLKSMFAVRAMTDEAESVSQDLEAGYSDAARESLSRIVSRDVSELDDSEIASATISSVAENVTDSVVGPLVAYGAFGLPGAAAYRAIDTLDSMIGYRGKYEHLGAAAAKLDDAASYVPARLAGGAVVAAASVMPGLRRAVIRPYHDRTTRPDGKSERRLADRRNGRRTRGRGRKDRPLQAGTGRQTSCGPRHSSGQPAVRRSGACGHRHRGRSDHRQRAMTGASFKGESNRHSNTHQARRNGLERPGAHPGLQRSAPERTRPGTGLERAADHVKRRFKPTRIWSSDLARCVQTAEALELPFRRTPTLREIGFGEWESLSWAELTGRTRRVGK